MAVFQTETGAATDRGFADLHANGILAKFAAWIVKAPAAGGPGWTILQDRSAAAGYAATVYTVTSTGLSHIMTSVAHGLLTGEVVRFTAQTTLPTGISAATDYFVNRLGADTFRIYSTMTKAWAGGASDINVSSAGVGTQWFTMEGPYIVVSDAAAPAVNQVCRIIKIGYRAALDANLIRVQMLLGFDAVNNVVYGYWGGWTITTSAAPFTYDFRGGAQCMVVQSLVSTVWYTAYMDSWTGDVSFLEAATATGVASITTGTGANSLITFGLGEEALFTVNKWYFIYDFGNGHSWCNYFKCTNVDLVNHRITADTITYAFPAGAVVSSYAHRFYCGGSAGTNVNRMSYPATNFGTQIPYYSSETAGSCLTIPDAAIIGVVYCGRDSASILQCLPDDEGFYVCQKPLLVEYHDDAAAVANRYYGAVNNMYLTAAVGMTAGTDGKTISAVNWLYFKLENVLNSAVSASASIAVMFLNTTSLV